MASTLSLFSGLSGVPGISKLVSEAKTWKPTKIMPVMFLGHGSPMNAIQENEFTRGWRSMGNTVEKPNAVLCISAHWETKGTYVTAMQKPKTIHDFGGFPPELFAQQYPAPGDPALATDLSETITKTKVLLDNSWGFDHGCWSVLKHLYPNADVPVLQLSLDYSQAPQYHYDLAKELQFLRTRGVLIVGSGNIVHNLGMLNWESPNTPFDWAIEANDKIKTLINDDRHIDLINYKNLGKSVALAVPTPEHFLPLLYILALKGKNEQVHYYNDKPVMGSITMTSISIA